MKRAIKMVGARICQALGGQTRKGMTIEWRKNEGIWEDLERRGQYCGFRDSMLDDNERKSVKRVNVEDARGSFVPFSRWWRIIQC